MADVQKSKKVTNMVRSWEGFGVLKQGMVVGKPAKVTLQMAQKPREKIRVTPKERSRPTATRSGERSRPAEPRNRSLDPVVPAQINKIRQVHNVNKINLIQSALIFLELTSCI